VVSVDTTGSAPQVQNHDGDPASVAQGFAAARNRPGIVVLLFVLAGLAWWSTAKQMAGMDAAPGTDLGTLGWFMASGW